MLLKFSTLFTYCRITLIVKLKINLSGKIKFEINFSYSYLKFQSFCECETY